jgi:hypothetical protein
VEIAGPVREQNKDSAGACTVKGKFILTLERFLTYLLNSTTGGDDDPVDFAAIGDNFGLRGCLCASNLTFWLYTCPCRSFFATVWFLLGCKFVMANVLEITYSMLHFIEICKFHPMY